MGDWNRAAKGYQLLLERPDNLYLELASKMLNLIEKLKNNEHLKDTSPNTAMMTLQLGLPGNRRRVHIDCQPDGKYSVGIDYYEPKYRVEFENDIDEEVILETILLYIEKLK